MFRSFLVALLLAIPFSVAAQAQQPADALKTCFADNTSGKDRKDLARWIFLAMAAHPEMKQHANATLAAATDDTSRTIAGLVTRLLTDSCVSEIRAVIKSGAPGSLELAFENLGQLAMQELMADKMVNDSMNLVERYIDQNRLADALLGK